ncbi:DUF5694 domain-containing protein [Microbulbifer sp. GL-2]|uniref:DUF5694 domain-containing protein n=1 Tax=Microbulbifer sp. GL-2 TaxID=2591606 RepID=UPI001164A672|nr:DUF5694 domain-containing protein [Microbulbifer sp. GL-2]BBM01620.1 hypothetical protein GL2_16940 [Microbulbifer sp. GL-2]
MRKITTILTSTLVLVINSLSYAHEKQITHDQEIQPAQVMLFGVFHFHNPGLDSVKSEVINVLTPKNQDYLEKLTSKLANENPTHVLIECPPKRQKIIDRQFSSYTNGNYKLNVNENQQLGFRIAAKAGLQGVICYDERNVHWKGAELRDFMDKNTPERKKAHDQLIKKSGQDTSQLHNTLSLSQLLRLNNNPSEERDNMNFYIMENDIGAGQEFIGADAAASWWHRNFRMYANIQAQAQPGTKVIAIGGSGHTAILKTLLEVDKSRHAWDVNEYL